MRPAQLRPKYPLEQYVVAFEFPGIPVGQPTVTVELVSGEDINYQDFAGYLLTAGVAVCILVVRGVPGCIYKISCECTVGVDTFVREGIVSVKPTAAIPPPGFGDPDHPELPPPVIPFTRTILSPIYPQEFSDSTNYSFTITGGVLQQLGFSARVEDDNTDYQLTFSAGQLFEAGASKTQPDEIDYALSFDSGILQVAPYGDLLDTIDYALTFSDGRLFPAPQGSFPDDTDYSLTFSGGSLYVP